MSGVCTPTEIGMAIDMGLSILKFFPAEALGGLTTLKAVSAVFNQVRFIPTGGINSKNLIDYLKHPKVIACAGSWMVQSELILGKNFDWITRLAREAVFLVKKARQSQISH